MPHSVRRRILLPKCPIAPDLVLKVAAISHQRATDTQVLALGRLEPVLSTDPSLQSLNSPQCMAGIKDCSSSFVEGLIEEKTGEQPETPWGLVCEEVALLRSHTVERLGKCHIAK
jgi:hypothetical protein